MSREQYQIPTAGSSSTGMGASKPFAIADIDPGAGAVSQYLCGDCGLKMPLRKGDPIRCKDCGCRILYKERTKRMVQFEAR